MRLVTMRLLLMQKQLHWLLVTVAVKLCLLHKCQKYRSEKSMQLSLLPLPVHRRWSSQSSHQPGIQRTLQDHRYVLVYHTICLFTLPQLCRCQEDPVSLPSGRLEKTKLGRPRITWLSTVQQDLKQHHLTLPEAADLAQNRCLWRMMSTYGATQS